MAIGGLMAYAFKAFLGNPDVMMSLITWGVLVTLSLTAIELYRESKD